MSPAELFNTASASASSASPSRGSGCSRKQQAPRRARDLLVQLPDGRLVRPLLPEGGAVLLVMNGEGLTRWMRPATTG